MTYPEAFPHLRVEYDGAGKALDEEAVEALVEAWARSYRDAAAGAACDLVRVSPGDGVAYLYDVQGAHGRVVAAWGRSRPEAARDDGARRRGFPRPARREDDRGHLFGRAFGGGPDINLAPMDSALNQGRSPQGAVFRRMERHCARTPGAFWFVRPAYADASTDRACGFDVGVETADGLWVERFANGPG